MVSSVHKKILSSSVVELLRVDLLDQLMFQIWLHQHCLHQVGERDTAGGIEGTPARRHARRPHVLPHIHLQLQLRHIHHGHLQEDQE